MELLAGSYVYLESYKHDGNFHRRWDNSYVLEVNEDYFITVTDHTTVYESDGKHWITREPAICYFSRKRWFNVIAMFRENGVYYYINLASPSLYDGEAIKYIDYDLDYKIYPGHKINLVDEDEYMEHKREMHYSDDIDEILHQELIDLKMMYLHQEEIFNQELNEQHFHQYLAKLL